jgi:GT2 family glycosyltransferase
MKLVSIVILNWNGIHFLRRFLPALTAHSRMEGCEIVVADNASSDGSLAFLESEYPDIRLISLEKNFGFAGGYNRALAQIDSTYFLLLNSDIEVTPGWLAPLVGHIEENKDCAACTPKIKDQNRRNLFEYAGAAGGFIDRFGYPFCRGRIFSHLEEDRGQYDQIAEVFWGSGACLLVRSDSFREAGGLDEHFFAHMEEIDLCWRFRRMGRSVTYIPASAVYHVGGGTLSQGHPRKTFLNFRNNLLLLHKNLPKEKRWRVLLIRMVLDGISALRFLAVGSPHDFLAVVRAHFAYYGMKHLYKGTGQFAHPKDFAFLASLIYPRSIAVDYFIRRKKVFGSLGWIPGETSGKTQGWR